MRLLRVMVRRLRVCFNPRICKRCDDYPRDNPLYPFSFNPRICKRCDPALTPKKRLNFSFNPRICKRCDQDIRAYLKHRNVSIHASVKDATSTCVFWASVRRFNPRICKRCDQLVFVQDSSGLRVSIHASVKDATIFGSV